MKEKKNSRIRRVVLILIPLIVLYLFFFPKTIDREFHLDLSWVIDLNKTSVDPVNNSSSVISFKSGDYFGYFTKNGDLLFRDQILYNAAISDTRFINYSSVSTNLVVMDYNGRFLLNIDSNGYPLFKNDRFFIISEDISTLMERDFSGDIIWQREFGSLITDMKANSGFQLVSLLDGRLELFANDGSDILSIKTIGSRISAVYGCALTSNNHYIAGITGIDPQKVSIYEEKNGEYRILSDINLPDTFRKRVFIDFSNDDEMLVFENTTGLSILEPGKDITKVMLKGVLKALSFENKDELLYSVSVSSTSTYFKVFESSGFSVFEKTFPSGDIFFKKIGSSLYLGVSDLIFKIDIKVV